MSWLTTHVLDTSRGRAAAGVSVRCEYEQDGTFTEIARGLTDDDGRLKTLFPPEAPMQPGTYRLTFETGAYFASQSVKSFFPQVQITFEASPGEAHYHVPLLISPFGYSTYRGS